MGAIKWVIGSVVVVGIVAFATKKYWMPTKTSKIGNSADQSGSKGGSKGGNKSTSETPSTSQTAVQTPTVAPIAPYNPLTDTDYNAKMSILTGDFYNKVMKGKGDPNSFATNYLPMSLADIKLFTTAYSSADSNSPINVARIQSIKNKYSTLGVFGSGRG